MCAFRNGHGDCMKHDYDFVILSKGRSGTHMLASFLNSHSMISCEGEFGKIDKKIQITKRGRVHGAIFMYNVGKFSQLRPRLKVIHLVRDPFDNAVSFARQQIRLRMRQAGRDDLPGAEFVPKTVGRLARQVKEQQDNVRERLGARFSWVEVTFEEITEGKEAYMMPEPVSRRLCAFLGVSFETLTCETRVEFGTGML